MGVAPANIDDQLLALLTSRPRPPYVPWEPEFRCSPKEWLPGAESVLVAAVKYPLLGNTGPPVEEQGCLASFAWAPDYHLLLKGMLLRLGAYIKEIVPNAEFACQVDNGPGCERLFAWRAGVGWLGKNNFIIVPGIGSFVWLGLLVTNIPLPPDQPLPSLCGNCQRCLNACPTGAYVGANDYHYSRCIAYWLTRKEQPTPEQARVLSHHHYLYGCDYCQLACPYNPPQPEWGFGDWHRLLKMSTADFESAFEDSAALWRGSKLLQRNLVLVSSALPECREPLLGLAEGEGLVATTAKLALGFAKGKLKGN